MNLNGFLSMTGNVSGSLGADLVVDVEANPSGVATQPLIKIRVGDVIYGIPTGGGGGVSSYNMLTDKPKINGIILQDELSLHSLGIQEEITFSGEATEYLNGEGYFSTPPFYVPINYDTEEQDSGIKWIDGKPLYMKTIPFSNVSKSDTVSFGISDVENIFLIAGKSSDSSPLPYVHGSAPSNNVGGFFSISQSDTGWSFRCGADAPLTLSGWICVAYTKSTD